MVGYFFFWGGIGRGFKMGRKGERHRGKDGGERVII